VVSISLLIVLGYLLLHPLFPALLWGGLLAVVSGRSYERLVGRLRGRRMLGVVVVGFVYALALIAPLLFMVLETIAYAPVVASLPDRMASAEMLDQIQKAEQAAAIQTGLPNWILTFRNHFDERVASILPHLEGAASWLVDGIGDLGVFLFEFMLGCVTALVILYNRFAVRAFLARLLDKVGGSFAQDLLDQAFSDTRGAFRGVIVAAFAQTVLAAVALVVADVPGVLLLSSMTFLLALVQVGPLAVAVIAGGILLIQGGVLAAALVIAWFLVVVMSVDNLIRPYFASQDSDTPAFLTFLGALGGLLAFGLIGVFIGPVLIALLHRLLLAWVEQPASEQI
jgi:predicted PurR-regulated permease PerM